MTPPPRPARGGVRAFLELARPANVVTALADVAAGAAAAGLQLSLARGLLLSPAGAPATEGAPALGDLSALFVATAGLYAGGVVLNDVFDAALDARERPERPIPSGRVSRRAAALFGGGLLLAGIAAAALASPTSALVALAVAGCAVLYDAVGKHHPLWGPVNMGACRGGNLLLGVSLVPAALFSAWYLALLPVAYIGAITAVSRGEVGGGRSATGYWAVALIAAVLGALLALGLRPDFSLAETLPYALLFAWLVVPAFLKAARTPEPATIRTAVRAGVLSLIVFDAALAAGFGGWLLGACVLALLPLSRGLARLFAVT